MRPRPRCFARLTERKKKFSGGKEVKQLIVVPRTRSFFIMPLDSLVKYYTICMRLAMIKEVSQNREHYEHTGILRLKVCNE